MGDKADTKSYETGLGRDLYSVRLDSHEAEPEGPGAAAGPPTEPGETESDFLFCMKKKEESAQESRVPVVPKVDPLSDRYDMTHEKRGHALIINNERFRYSLRQQGLGNRHGTAEDEKGLKRQLKKLGFKITTYHNCTAEKMMTACQELAAMDHSDCDCFVCVMLSHGEEGVIYGTDKAIELKELFKLFRGNSCPSLAGKPKIFFIQACRGYQTDAGVDVSVTVARDDIDAGRVYPDAIKLPVDADFLLAYSTVPGYYSWRNGAFGSWFIIALCEMLEKYGTEMELMKLLTVVNQLVAFKFRSSNPDNPDFHRMKQIPCITSMLTKDVYFSEKK